MNNPRTTTAGYAVILCAVLYIGYHIYHASLSLDDLKAVVVIIGGSGLVAASDGGH